MSKTIEEVKTNNLTKKMSKPMYQVVTTEGAEMLTYAQLSAKYDITGINKKTHNRIEIQGKPVLADFHGPMYNGVNDTGQVIVRYESYKAYEMYSN